MKKRTLLGLATVSSLLFSSQGAFAHSAAEAQPGGLRDLMGRSAAVAFGKVVDIQYRNSEPTREEPNGVPHTFVTYAIDTVFRGSLPEKFTLRIPGGADGKGGQAGGFDCTWRGYCCRLSSCVDWRMKKRSPDFG
jgi:hypothetical protein